jgi:L-threonylcarbamoyladenylate synthase
MHLTISQAISTLREGGIVAFPTETVYGLGACADNPQAVEKVFVAKQRPRDNPLICHFYSSAQIQEWGIPLSPLAKLLLDTFSPGPLSLLLDLPLPSPLTAATLGQGSVICRIPNHTLALELLRGVGVPLAAPSANTSGRMSGTNFEMVERDLGNRIDGIVDGGGSVVGIESTIVDVRGTDELIILRPGIIGRDELQSVVDMALEKGLLTQKIIVRYAVEHSQEVTPGSSYSHYAPVTPLTQIDTLQDLPQTKENCVIVGNEEQLREVGVQPHSASQPFFERNRWYISLGSTKDLAGIVRHLYYTLYQVDSLGLTQGFFLKQTFSESSLARALYNRLQKIVSPRGQGG